MTSLFPSFRIGFHSLSSVLLILFLLPLSKVQAQVSGGMIAGVAASQIDGDDWGGYNFWGYQFGGFANYKFDDSQIKSKFDRNDFN